MVCFRLPGAAVLTLLLVACSAAAPKIYIASPDGHTITTYTAAGVRTAPTITLPHQLNDMAVDAAGKIHVLGSDYTVTTYTAAGVQTTPTITGLRGGATGIAVDAAGKIYIANAADDTVTTYTSVGVRTIPTFTSPPEAPSPQGIAVDAAGKIYVADYVDGTITTYTAAGVKTTPTITGLSLPNGFAVDAAGKIYVADADGPLHTYKPDGSRTPTITLPKGPDASDVAVDRAGKIYVLSSADGGNHSIVRTYNADGTPSTPTITDLPGRLIFPLSKSPPMSGTSWPLIAVH